MKGTAEDYLARLRLAEIEGTPEEIAEEIDALRRRREDRAAIVRRTDAPQERLGLEPEQRPALVIDADEAERLSNEREVGP